MIYICRGCCNLYYYLVFGCVAREILIVKPAANLVITNTQISISTKIDLLYSYFAMCILSAPHFTHFKTKTLGALLCISITLIVTNGSFYYWQQRGRACCSISSTTLTSLHGARGEGNKLGPFNSRSEKLWSLTKLSALSALSSNNWL